MAKRPAEKQLTDRNWLDEDTSHVPLVGPIQTAAPQAIMQRQIRGLPSKKAAHASPGLSCRSPGSAFASPTGASSNPFQALPSPLGSTPTPKPFTFASSSKDAAAFGFSGASGGSASGNSVAFPERASGSTPGASFPPSNLGKPASPAPSKETTSQPCTEAITLYYSSLRGLNVSVILSLEALIREDAFVNLENVFDRLKLKYGEHHQSIEREFRQTCPDSGASDTVSNHQSSAPPTTERSRKTSGEKAQQNSPESGTPKSPPPAAPSNSLASYPSHQDTGAGHSSAKTTSRPATFATAAPMRPSPLRYETAGEPIRKEDTCDQNSEAKPAPLPTKNGSLFPSVVTTAPSLVSKLGGSGLDSNPSAAVPAKGLFGSSGTSGSLFGPKLSTPSQPVVFGEKNTTLGTPPKPGFQFGFGMAAGTTSGSTFGSFGTPTDKNEVSPPKNNFNPVGFSFGGSPSAPKVAPSGLAPVVDDAAKTSPDDNCNKSAPVTSADPQGLESHSSTGLAGGALGSVPGSAILDTNKGEEEEDTLFEATGRIYALVDKLQEDGTKRKDWVGWAVSTVKLNRNRTTNKSRILARAQTTKNILVNFIIRSNLQPVMRGPAIEFVGVENSAPQAYRFRPATVETAQAFLSALVDVVKKL